jgi:hypothetical protein
LIVETLRLVMTTIVFQIDDTFWWQYIDIAMGTPCAYIYVNTIYGHHEQTKILPHHRNNLTLIGRFIDDMLDVLTGPEEDWPFFKDSLQGFGKILWIYSDLSSSVVFLELPLSFAPENSTTSSTYQKLLHLYLYITPTSAHPPS